MRSVVNERNTDRHLPLPLLRFKDHGCGHAALETVRRSDPTPIVGISAHYSWKWRKTVSFPLLVEFWGRLEIGPIQGRDPAGNPAIDERHSYNSKREE